jgi:hypothetical protein
MASPKAQWPKKGESNFGWADRTKDITKAARQAERLLQKRRDRRAKQ